MIEEINSSGPIFNNESLPDETITINIINTPHSNTRYESIHIRPVNARFEDQVRRNHSIQYYSYPDYKFDRLRKESPERYESFADMKMNKWISMKIEVKGTQAKLFLDDNMQPSLIVNDLKHGANLSGTIGLWVEVGTEGYFKDLKITRK
jgi:hypothetical protein